MLSERTWYVATQIEDRAVRPTKVRVQFVSKDGRGHFKDAAGKWRWVDPSSCDVVPDENVTNEGEDPTC